jgi:hypothetical protein
MNLWGSCYGVLILFAQRCVLPSPYSALPRLAMDLRLSINLQPNLRFAHLVLPERLQAFAVTFIFSLGFGIQSDVLAGRRRLRIAHE